AEHVLAWLSDVQVETFGANRQLQSELAGERCPPGACGVDEAARTDSAGRRPHDEPPGAAVRVDREARHLRIRADYGSCIDGAKREERGREARVRVALLCAVGGAEQILSEVRSKVAEL